MEKQRIMAFEAVAQHIVEGSRAHSIIGEEVYEKANPVLFLKRFTAYYLQDSLLGHSTHTTESVLGPYKTKEDLLAFNQEKHKLSWTRSPGRKKVRAGGNSVFFTGFHAS